MEQTLVPSKRETFLKFLKNAKRRPPLILRDEAGFEEVEGEISDRVMVKEVSRKPTAVCVLKFLLNANEPPYFEQVYKGLKINPLTVRFNLIRLSKLGIVEGFIHPANRRLTFYRITDPKIAVKIVQRFYFLIGLKFAKLIPFDESTYEDDLRENRTFKALCEKLHVTADEAIEALKNCTREVDVKWSDYVRCYSFERRKCESA